MKRKEGEGVEAYRVRRRMESEAVKKHLKGKRVRRTKKEIYRKAQSHFEQFGNNIL